MRRGIGTAIGRRELQRLRRKRDASAGPPSGHVHHIRRIRAVEGEGERRLVVAAGLRIERHRKRRGSIRLQHQIVDLDGERSRLIAIGGNRGNRQRSGPDVPQFEHVGPRLQPDQRPFEHCTVLRRRHVAGDDDLSVGAQRHELRPQRVEALLFGAGRRPVGVAHLRGAHIDVAVAVHRQIASVDGRGTFGHFERHRQAAGGRRRQRDNVGPELIAHGIEFDLLRGRRDVGLQRRRRERIVWRGRTGQAHVGGHREVRADRRLRERAGGRIGQRHVVARDRPGELRADDRGGGRPVIDLVLRDGIGRRHRPGRDVGGQPRRSDKEIMHRARPR